MFILHLFCTKCTQHISYSNFETLLWKEIWLSHLTDEETIHLRDYFPNSNGKYWYFKKPKFLSRSPWHRSWCPFHHLQAASWNLHKVSGWLNWKCRVTLRPMATLWKVKHKTHHLCIVKADTRKRIKKAKKIFFNTCSRQYNW